MTRPIAAALAFICFVPALPAQEDARIAASLRKAIANNVRKGGAGEIKKLAEQCDKLPAPPKTCAEAWDWYAKSLRTWGKIPNASRISPNGAEVHDPREIARRAKTAASYQFSPGFSAAPIARQEMEHKAERNNCRMRGTHPAREPSSRL